MQSGNKEIDKILDKKLKNALMKKTSDEFTDNLMKQINLSHQFAKEDKKESKVLVYITGGISLFILSFLILIGVFYESSPGSSRTKNVFNNFSTLLQENILAIYNKIGISFSLEYLLIILMIIVFIAMSNVTDKIFLRKR
ncbi:MAG TPA: hypothetical protein PLG90_02780 [Ignavibacteria bacterium]|nr:hypothetical protein [Ignavibacteria bacterium]